MYLLMSKMKPLTQAMCLIVTTSSGNTSTEKGKEYKVMDEGIDRGGLRGGSEGESWAEI